MTSLASARTSAAARFLKDAVSFVMLASVIMLAFF